MYKHTITGLIAEPDTPEVDPEQVTLTFLSKYANSFASNSSLADFGASILHTEDANTIISPMIVGNSSGINVTLYPIVANGSLSQIHIFFPYSTSGNFYYQITASRNTSGITDTVTPYIQVSGGSGSSASLPNYYEVAVNVSSQNSGGNEEITFNISEENLNIFLSTANQQLSGTGYTLTKDNWSTLVPQLATANSALRHYLIRGLLMLSNNASATDIDGYSNMIYVSATGTIKIGYDPGDYTEVVSSSVTPISNHF